MSSTAPSHHAHEMALAARHANLEAQILAETMRPSPDMATLAGLKKAKLKIKDVLHGG
ncbi:MAG: YdcH family protein [Sphingopyxis sp.]